MVDSRGRNKHWDSFEGQTRMKHYVLHAYLDRWPRVLIQAGKKRLWFIDAFAGRGRDNRGNSGSPLIARNISTKIANEFPGAEIHIIAIEADHDNFLELARNLADDCVEGGCATVFEGTLEDHIETVMSMIGSDPALFFLDPFGVKGLSAELVERALSADGREVLALFDDDGAARVHAAAKASSKPQKTGPQPSLSLFPDDKAVVPRKRKQQSAESSARSAEATEDVLRKVFGPRWTTVEDKLRGLRGIARRDLLLDEYVELMRDLKATHVLPLSVRDEEDRHHYYLVHASRHKKAFTVMKDAIGRAIRQRDEEPGIRRSLLFEWENDVVAIADSVAQHFGGATEVRWQDGKHPGTVLAFAMEETLLLPNEKDALKEELARRGYVIKVAGKKALMYSFPTRAI